jgi:hypothetical protein
METLVFIVIFLLHAYVVFDVLRNFRTAGFGISSVLAVIPILGPIFYLASKKEGAKKRRTFMEGRGNGTRPA